MNKGSEKNPREIHIEQRSEGQKLRSYVVKEGCTFINYCHIPR